MQVAKDALPPVYVVGGNVNNKLYSWLAELGVHDFLHLALDITSIAPEDLKATALMARQELVAAAWIISVGSYADKILGLALLDHGVLPLTSLKDKKQISDKLMKCRNYLYQRSLNYVSSYEPKWPGPSSG